MRSFLDPPPTDQRDVLAYLGQVYNAISLFNNTPVTSVSAARTILPDESGIYLLANTGTFNVTLPDPGRAGAGWQALFIKTTSDAAAVTLVGTINGASNNSDIDAQYDRIGLVTNGTEYFITEYSIA